MPYGKHRKYNRVIAHFQLQLSNYFNNLMMQSSHHKINTQTRGRPKKQQTRTLAPLYKELFSDNSAIIHTCFLIYVFQVFVQTKNEKRVGHKDGGFTIYDKLNTEYCFDNLEQHLEAWGYTALLSNQNMRAFVKLLPALGPKLILEEIVKLINFIMVKYQEGLKEEDILAELMDVPNLKTINQDYPYMRFAPSALKELKLEKLERWDRGSSLSDLIQQRVGSLWKPLLKIIIHTVINSIQGKIYNKYFKPFFSDAENPHETYIGQLNLEQVVAAVEKFESAEKTKIQEQQCLNLQEEPIEPIQRIKKIRQIVDNNGTRTVHLIKVPERNHSEGQHKMKKNEMRKEGAIREPIIISNSNVFKPTIVKLTAPSSNTNIEKIENILIKPLSREDSASEKVIKVIDDKEELMQNQKCESESSFKREQIQVEVDLSDVAVEKEQKEQAQD